MSTTTVSARVKLEIEIVGDAPWSGECSVDQVHKQAAESAVGFIENLIDKIPGVRQRVRIIGKPTVTAVIVERKP